MVTFPKQVSWQTMLSWLSLGQWPGQRYRRHLLVPKAFLRCLLKFTCVKYISLPLWVVYFSYDPCNVFICWIWLFRVVVRIADADSFMFCVMIFTNFICVMCMLRRANCVGGRPKIDIMWILAEVLALHRRYMLPSLKVVGFANQNWSWCWSLVTWGFWSIQGALVWHLRSRIDLWICILALAGCNWCLLVMSPDMWYFSLYYVHA